MRQIKPVRIGFPSLPKVADSARVLASGALLAAGISAGLEGAPIAGA
jgi:hypothetical protein